MRKTNDPCIMCHPLQAGVAKLADASDLGSGGVTPVEVRVLSPALLPPNDSQVGVFCLSFFISFVCRDLRGMSF